MIAHRKNSAQSFSWCDLHPPWAWLNINKNQKGGDCQAWFGTKGSVKTAHLREHRQILESQPLCPASVLRWKFSSRVTSSCAKPWDFLWVTVPQAPEDERMANLCLCSSPPRQPHLHHLLQHLRPAQVFAPPQCLLMHPLFPLSHSWFSHTVTFPSLDLLCWGSSPK